jgi:hypothetical protein
MSAAPGGGSARLQRYLEKTQAFGSAVEARGNGLRGVAAGWAAARPERRA